MDLWVIAHVLVVGGMWGFIALAVAYMLDEARNGERRNRR